MFRLIGANTGNAIKRTTSTKLVGKNTRFFNSTTPSSNLTNIEQSAVNNNEVIFGSNGANRQYNNNNNNRNNNRNNNNNNNNNNKNYNNNYRPNHHFIIAEDNPYRNELLQFDEITNKNYRYDLNKEKVIANEYMSSESFLKNVETVMALYSDLSEAQQLNEHRVASLIMLLRNGLRFNRLALKGLERKPDYDDVNSLNYKIYEFLLSAFRAITQDILDQKILVNSHGCSTLIHAYIDMRLKEEAVNIWELGRNIPSLKNVFKNDQVLGSIFPLLAENKYYKFDELEKLFNEVKTNKAHPTLILGFLRVCLVYNEKDKAINLFTELTELFYGEGQQQESFTYKPYVSYLTDAHLSFIGYCNDLPTAKIFFDNARSKSMPYPTPLLVNYINLYLENTWNQTKDIFKVIEIWLNTWENFAIKRNLSNIISASLNNKFLTIFFTKYNSFGSVSFNLLKELIERYSKIRPLDEPFLNNLITKSSAWREVSVLESIESAYDLFNVPKTVVAYRCLIKAFGNVQVSTEKIYRTFTELVKFNDNNNMRYLSNADWLCFKNATITSSNLSSFANKDERIMLYFKCLKLYGPYFRDVGYYKKTCLKDAELDNGAYKPFIDNLNNLNTDDINMCQMKNMRRNF